MRNLFICLTLVLLVGGVALTSCLKKPTNYLVDVENGALIVSMVRPQNIVTMDPLNISFRLNTLLATVERQKAESPEKNITIDNVEVISQEGTQTISKNLKKMLFGDADIKEDQAVSGIWTITYKLNSVGIGAGEADNLRKGVVTVTTGGKLLKDMNIDSTDYWSVTTGEELDAYQMINASGMLIFCEIRSCLIAKTAISTWMATVMSTAFVEEDKDKSRGWYGHYTITQSGSGQDYESTLTSTYTFEEISADGVLLASNMIAAYSAKDLKYSPQCSSSFTPYAGSESITVTFDDLIIVPNRVRMSYGGSPKDCSRYYLLTYNGYTYDSRTNQVTGGDR